MFSLTGYAGINIVLHLVKYYGALIAVTGNLFWYIDKYWNNYVLHLVNIFYSDNMSKSSNDCFIFYFLHKAVYFPVIMRLLLFYLYYLNYIEFLSFFFRYLWSGLLVLIGIYLNLLSKNRDKWEAMFKLYIQRLFFLRKSYFQAYNTNDSIV